MNKEFMIELISDVDVEGMVVEVSFETKTIARLNYEKGIDNIEIEIILQNEDVKSLIFPLENFLLALEKAKKILVRCAKEDEENTEK